MINKKREWFLVGGLCLALGTWGLVRSSGYLLEASGALVVAESLTDQDRSLPSGSTFTWEFEIRNVSDGPVSLEARKASCACTEVKFTPVRIGPREIAQLKIVSSTPLSGIYEGNILVHATSELDVTPPLNQDLWFSFGGRIQPDYGLKAAPNVFRIPGGESVVERSVDLLYRGREGHWPGSVVVMMESGEGAVELIEGIAWEQIERLGGDAGDISWAGTVKLRFTIDPRNETEDISFHLEFEEKPTEQVLIVLRSVT